jgi:hypothetical protein
VTEQVDSAEALWAFIQDVLGSNLSWGLGCPAVCHGLPLSVVAGTRIITQ